MPHALRKSTSLLPPVRLRREPDPSRVILLIPLAAIVLAFAGCGGGSHTESGGHDAGGEAEQGQGEALSKIPPADRTAFIQLATAIGVVRARAAPVAVGTSPRLAQAAPLVAARAQVVRLRPENAQLIRIRDELIPLLTRFSRAPLSGSAARVAARAAIRSADGLEARLRAYTKSAPAIGGLIPD